MFILLKLQTIIRIAYVNIKSAVFSVSRKVKLGKPKNKAMQLLD